MDVKQSIVELFKEFRENIGIHGCVIIAISILPALVMLVVIYPAFTMLSALVIVACMIECDSSKNHSSKDKQEQHLNEDKL